jgi:hypothetical protein
MHGLTPAELGQACRLFLDLAYPDGPGTVPPKKRAYYAVGDAASLDEYLPPAPASVGICQPLSTRKDGPRGYEFRLGSAHFPHLKLRVQLMEHRGRPVWVYTVDTHDAFSRTSIQPPPDHPDAAGLFALQEANRRVKDQVEEALEQAGLPTFKSLLRSDLAAPAGR